jgi:drug/metabolite transporter (DMT)-like permease
VEKSWADRLISAGSLIAVIGVYFLFFKGPAANQQQQFFRIGVVGVGVALGAVGLILKATAGRGDDPE